MSVDRPGEVSTDMRKNGWWLSLLLLLLGWLWFGRAEPAGSPIAPVRPAPIRAQPGDRGARAAHQRTGPHRVHAPVQLRAEPEPEPEPEPERRLEPDELFCLAREKMSESMDRLLGLLESGVSEETRAEMRDRLLDLAEHEFGRDPPQQNVCGWAPDLEAEIADTLCVDAMRRDPMTAERVDALGLCDG